MLTAMALTVSLVTGCGSDGGGRPAAVNDDPTMSVPFSIDAPPGFRLVTAGVGTTVQRWGADSTGTDEPLTVLSTDGEVGTGDGVVVVSATGFEGQEGGLAQSNRGYMSENREDFEVDGRPAVYFPGREADGSVGMAGWADLTVVRGADLALSVGKDRATKDELLAVAAASAVGAEHLEAPSLAKPPAGLQVVGSVDADLPIALRAPVEANSDRVPGSSRSHAIAWSKGKSTVVAFSLPPGSVDVAALPALGIAGRRAPADVERLEVDGRVGAAGELDEYGPARWVALDSGWGDTILLVAKGDAAPGIGDLTDLAASAARVGQAAWDDFVVDATGGPGLHADEGRRELLRGEHDGIEWLLQSAPGPAADPCLKLSTRRRACATGGGERGDTTILSAESPDEVRGLPPFTVVTTVVGGASVRLTVGDRTATGRLVALPGGERWGGVVFIDPDGAYVSQALCGERPATMTGVPVRIDVLDDDGAVAGCVSLLDSYD